MRTAPAEASISSSSRCRCRPWRWTRTGEHPARRNLIVIQVTHANGPGRGQQQQQQQVQMQAMEMDENRCASFHMEHPPPPFESGTSDKRMAVDGFPGRQKLSGRPGWRSGPPQLLRMRTGPAEASISSSSKCRCRPWKWTTTGVQLVMQRHLSGLQILTRCQQVPGLVSKE